MDRRSFLGILGLAGTGAAAGCDGAPLSHLYAYLTPPQDVVPGVAVHYATVCRACPAGCGLLVKTREARPIKLEGNPLHPVNRGAICARGQAFIQSLYSRDRVARPLLRDGAKLVPVDWERALSFAGERLKAARSVGILSSLESGSLEDVFAEWRQSFPRAEQVIYEPGALGSLRAASRLLFGLDEVPEVDLTSADHVLSIGADFLDSWLSPVAFSRAWSERHGYGPGGRQLQVEYFGARRNLTANAADRFHRRPAESLCEVMQALLAAVLRARQPADPAVTALGLSLTAEIDTEVAHAARRLLAARRGVVLFGGAEAATVDATSAQAAALLVNHLIGAMGQSLHYGRRHVLSKVDPAVRAVELLRRAGEGRVDVLVLHRTNPVYTLPGSVEAERLIHSSKLVVALSSELDETATAAHLVLPVHHPLEAWGDYEVNDAVLGLLQPVREPLHHSRPAGDVLLDLLRRSGRKPRHPDFQRYLQARWSERGSDWRAALAVGGEFRRGTASRLAAPPTVRHAPELFSTGGPALRGPGHVVLLAPQSAALFDGRDRCAEWLRETPDSLTQGTWDVPAELAVDVASAAGLRTGDRVRVQAGGRDLITAAYIDPDLAPGTIALRQGGSASGRPSVEGGNVMSLLDAVFDPLSGELALTQTRVSVSRVGPGDWASVSGGTESRKRLLCLAMELADARAGRFPVMTRHGEQRAEAGEHPPSARLPMPHDDVASEGRRPADNMYSLQRHPEHRWAMVVDLDRCTGCGACVVACYAENNVPVVGRAEILRGRELAWIRIEKHVFEGEGRDRRVRFLPVMCQHCAQAPCETVCPVFAAYHTPDGLNGQVYNRCIGTRYCSNNCPYKVRRFNYFDYRRDPAAAEQLNPDVTVRSRGVMEKCTFCIQRIREATNRAKAEGRSVKDGEIVPACVQTCPTRALAFGDLKQPGWAIQRLVRDARGYRLLDYQVNTRPSVVYLRKVYSELEDA